MADAQVRIKILATKRRQRYAVWRAVTAACEELKGRCPALQVEVEAVCRSEQIEAYTPVVIYPSLCVNERLVCVGRFPRKDEITGWLRQALE